MTKLLPYLNFDSNCKEAMEFYQSCLGGELKITKVGETPVAEGKTDKEKEEVMHSSLVSKDISFLGSDMISGDKAEQGNTISLCLYYDDLQEAQEVFAKLSVGGEVKHKLEKQFWGDTFGYFIDKYGFRWMFNVEPKA